MIENLVPTPRRKMLSFQQQHEESVSLEGTAQQLDTGDTTVDNVSHRPALNFTGDEVEGNRDMELIARTSLDIDRQLESDNKTSDTIPLQPALNSTTDADHIDELFVQDHTCRSRHFKVRQEADANYRANAEK